MSGLDFCGYPFIEISSDLHQNALRNLKMTTVSFHGVVRQRAL